jgi:hypothetical protein
MTRGVTAMRLWPAWIVCLCAAFACGDGASHASTADAGQTQLPDKTAGKACKHDSDCPNGRCMRELQIDGVSEARPAPGGYCTAACDTDGQCGKQGECSVPADSDRGLCLGSCRTQDDCRSGYACVGGGEGIGLALSGNCQPMQAADSLGDRVAGRECADDADCLGGSCASVSPVGARYPGNYCTGRCWKDQDCGAGGACLALTGTAEAGWCFEHCAADADCGRRGYRCRELFPDLDACFPAPDALPDHTAGRACTSDKDCGGAEDTCASELPYDTFSSFKNIAAPGGYCTQPCSLDSDCGAGAQCISHGVQGGMCLALCSDKSECRAGYDFVPHGRDPESKVCVPRN